MYLIAYVNAVISSKIPSCCCLNPDYPTSIQSLY